jgi:hypothetical protein
MQFLLPKMNVVGARTSDHVFNFCAYATQYCMAMVLISLNDRGRVSARNYDGGRGKCSSVQVISERSRHRLPSSDQ